MNLATRLLIKINNCCLLVFIPVLTACILLPACNSGDKTGETNTDSTKKGDTAQAGLMGQPPSINNSYQYFILDSQTIANNRAELYPKSAGTSGNTNLLIGKLNFKGISSNTVMLDLFMYPDENHSRHGRDKNKIYVRDTSLTKLLEDTVIFGNNYFDWWAIRSVIFTRISGTNYELIENFGFLLFEPMNTEVPASTSQPACTKCKGHLWYKIRYFYKDKTEFTPGGGGGEGSSNPSPPAWPD